VNDAEVNEERRAERDQDQENDEGGAGNRQPIAPEAL
jgi:hypothetical protein